MLVLYNMYYRQNLFKLIWNNIADCDRLQVPIGSPASLPDQIVWHLSRTIGTVANAVPLLQLLMPIFTPLTAPN
jgi:hypothetical protein